MKNQTQHLSPKQKAILADYMVPHKKETEYYGKHKQFMIYFLRNPDNFVPTVMAKRMAYVNFVIRRYDGGTITRRDVYGMPIKDRDTGKPIVSNVIFQSDISDWDRLRNVRVEVD